MFALDPYYLEAPGEDMHGFRAVAERSVLADAVKDSGAVSLFPRLAEHWDRQVRVLNDWNHFELADFERVAKLYPVTWIVTRQPAPSGLLCPYQNQTVSANCRPSPGLRKKSIRKKSTMINGKRIAVVMPAYNAEKTLVATVRELPDTVDERILVDDFSADRTVAAARELGLTCCRRKELEAGANQKTRYAQAPPPART